MVLGDSSTDPAAVMAAASALKAQQTDAQQAYVKRISSTRTAKPQTLQCQ
ncbi:hypothetical protein HaLaN_09069 [Haematococcus lacustris]|uniref:Uncharacterized protein n=1 Tax=Haematococcus lacustris TaxID=44745 RepID=A0A699Z2K0_HAELA|nr:hypothetical protein HaLaN_09069 [Haematococcus lacustris]